MADYTNKNFRLNGVNQDGNYEKPSLFRIDLAEIGATTAGEAALVDIPAGEAVVGAALVGEIALAGTSAALTFGVKAGTATVAFGSSVSSLGVGEYKPLTVSGVTYSDDPQKIVVTVAGTVTAGKFLLYVKTLPVKEFTTRG